MQTQRAPLQQKHFSFDSLSENFQPLDNIWRPISSENDGFSLILMKFSQVYINYQTELSRIFKYPNRIQQEPDIRSLTYRTIKNYISLCDFQQVNDEEVKKQLQYAGLDLIFIDLWYVQPQQDQQNLLFIPLQRWIEKICCFNAVDGTTWDYQFFQLLIRGEQDKAADLVSENCQKSDLQSIIKNHSFWYQDGREIETKRLDRSCFIEKIYSIEQNQQPDSLTASFLKALQGDHKFLLKYCNHDWKQYILLYLLLNSNFTLGTSEIRQLLLSNQANFEFHSNLDEYFFSLITAQNFFDVFKLFEQTGKVWIVFFSFKLLLGIQLPQTEIMTPKQLQLFEQYYRLQLLLLLQGSQHKFEVYLTFAREYLIIDKQITDSNFHRLTSKELHESLYKKAFEAISLEEIYERCIQCLECDITQNLGHDILKTLVQLLFQTSYQLQPAELGATILNFLGTQIQMSNQSQSLFVLEDQYRDLEVFQTLYVIYKLFIDNLIYELQKPDDHNFVSHSLLYGYQTDSHSQTEIFPFMSSSLMEPLMQIIQLKFELCTKENFYNYLFIFFTFKWEESELQHTQAQTILSIFFLLTIIEKRPLINQIFQLDDQQKQIVLVNLSLICTRIQQSVYLEANENKVIQQCLKKTNFLIQKLLQ